MPIYSKQEERFHQTQVQRAIVRNPQASVREIQNMLEKIKTPLKLDKDYVLKLKNAVFDERIVKADKVLLKVIMVEFMQRIRETDLYLWNILTSKMSSNKEKVMAARELRHNFESMIEKFFDAGLFDRKLGEVKFSMVEVLEAAKQIEEDEKRSSDSQSQTRPK